ncbi:hypothetical protein Aspvir_004382 [Aspergillus viridinutans]|uniref:Uncharacterized protein n=1 Tax=Aspergillus viridinutans TaxID=75553 RepID=A0A9P3F0I0_ASPVI|nr:uncharacterized protein Aspvir_004382 [Aspergillus viridinutans]GIK00359.1 hypothetical protein Aspvir_004382 [Aspergillus viridinutans]
MDPNDEQPRRTGFSPDKDILHDGWTVTPELAVQAVHSAAAAFLRWEQICSSVTGCCFASPSSSRAVSTRSRCVRCREQMDDKAGSCSRPADLRALSGGRRHCCQRGPRRFPLLLRRNAADADERDGRTLVRGITNALAAGCTMI